MAIELLNPTALLALEQTALRRSLFAPALSRRRSRPAPCRAHRTVLPVPGPLPAGPAAEPAEEVEGDLAPPAQPQFAADDPAFHARLARGRLQPAMATP